MTYLDMVKLTFRPRSHLKKGKCKSVSATERRSLLFLHPFSVNWEEKTKVVGTHQHFPKLLNSHLGSGMELLSSFMTPLPHPEDTTKIEPCTPSRLILAISTVILQFHSN